MYAGADSGDGREVVLAEEVVEGLLQQVLHGLVLVEADLLDLAGDLGIEECGDGFLADAGGRDGAGRDAGGERSQRLQPSERCGEVSRLGLAGCGGREKAWPAAWLRAWAMEVRFMGDLQTCPTVPMLQCSCVDMLMCGHVAGMPRFRA